MIDAYKTLSQLIIAQCPAGYDRAALEAELDEDWAQISVRCQSASGEEVKPRVDNLNIEKIHDTLDLIRDDMSKKSGEKWKKCIFFVTDKGKFKINVFY